MGKNGQSSTPVIRELVFRHTAGSPPGLELVDLAALAERALRHGNDPYAPLRPAFHQLIAVRSGRIGVWVDFAAYEPGAGDWLWIRPGQVQRWGPGLTEADGVVVAFPPGFPDSATTAASVADPTFARGPISPAGPEAEGLRRALDHLRYEYDSSSQLPLEAHLRALRHLLAVLVERLTAACGSESGRAVPSETFRRFHRAVERDFAATRRVEDYAAALGYSRRTLTRATEAATGMSAKRYVDERVVLEAKRELAHGDLAVGAVAERLGFAGAGDFTKFFRQRTGATPTAFRRRARGA
ncbi:AraC family transcriptional regulator [Streptomyces sp. SID685]|uniref:helix-turn-helix domain-containing protein n=1 Tax=Streptomyces sp. SID685 TaxID=2690322 RepID=UPI0019297BBD|nr:AraC family transcriptional regulator [Streptomyces sp. SID685]